MEGGGGVICRTVVVLGCRKYFGKGKIHQKVHEHIDTDISGMVDGMKPAWR
jgi:hypothetical protein